MRDLFAAHNEHRIALKRLADLAIFWWQGGWNVWFQLVLNAALHALTAGTLVALFWKPLDPRFRVGFATGIAVLFASLSGWQNALWGFESQVCFANLLTVALFSNGGGALAIPAVIVATFIFGESHLPRPRSVPEQLLLGVILAAAFALRVSPPGHQPYHAHTAAQFLGPMAHAASWPHVDSAWPWIILQLPLLVLCAVRCRQRRPLDAVERCALALGGFALLQAAAIAYTRGAALPEFCPLSRYQDPLLLGVAVQLFCGLQLARQHGWSGRLLLLGWVAVAAIGLLRLTETNLTLHLSFKLASNRENTANVRAFLDAPPAARANLEASLSGLHPNPAVVRRVIEDSRLQPYLPGELRVPRDPASATPPWIVRQGFVLTLLAAALLLAALAASRRRIITAADA